MKKSKELTHILKQVTDLSVQQATEIASLKAALNLCKKQENGFAQSIAMLSQQAGKYQTELEQLKKSYKCVRKDQKV